MKKQKSEMPTAGLFAMACKAIAVIEPNLPGHGLGASPSVSLAVFLNSSFPFVMIIFGTL